MSWRRGTRWLVRISILLALLLGLWMGGDLAYVLIDAETDHAAPADVIIILGCPSYENNVPAATFSACIQARAHHAASLYQRGLAATVIPSGGLTGPPPSEAG